ncbi:hypothetical protein PHO31112_02619 [Pandoraea horticolens]|uniref:Uncharacterized protein n=1 Tax=Pandoraea horticolens TaxID=2508298 RepID=A0A5E4VFH5_9BURK|nr:hypothetical protein PHO31112_02619 [Pandoraea horticolens]
MLCPELQGQLQSISPLDSKRIDVAVFGFSRRARRNHADRFQQSGKAINAKVRLYSRIGRALLEAEQSGGDPFAAIESIIPWDAFSDSINEAEALARPEDFDFLALVGDGFTQLRRYTPTLLDTLLRAK